MVTAKRSPVRKVGAEFDFSAILAYVPDLSGDEADITAELTAAFVAAYASSAPDVAINTTVRDAAAKWARTRAGDLISDITEATRDRVRELVANAVENGLSPQQLARSIRDDAVFGKERAETVSVTESAFALGQGQRTAAEDQGQDERSWVSEADACDACSANTDDGWISLDDDYSSGDNSIPQHPRCRCTEIYRTKRLYEEDAATVTIAKEVAPTLEIRQNVRCPDCHRLMGHDVQVGARLWCGRCREEKVVKGLV